MADTLTTRLTPHQAKYIAWDLTRRHASDSVDKLGTALADAQVDLNPHQVEAALFAFQNPFSKGAILADEVGLGKTIEAGLLLAQNWAERKRRLLVIVPANLRKQWSQELADKFYLPSAILETKTFNDAVRAGNLNPFEQPAVVICSYQFAKTKEPYVRQTAWDLVVIDEAHRLRNVYKNGSKTAIAIKNAVAPFRKVLLTATPLQNTLMELYGLVSIIDEYAFADLVSYKAKYSRLNQEIDFADLKARLRPICKRTLRKQVLEYVKYTNRHALVQEFVPSAEEQKLYDLVSEYLRRPKLYALPASQRQLVTLVLRKLLASSTYAIAATLAGLVERLDAAAAEASEVEASPEAIASDFEEFDELDDEWEGEGSDSEAGRQTLTAEELAELRAEADELREFQVLAASIAENSKGEALLTALRKGFAAAEDAQRKQGTTNLQQKAVIFTESRKTQQYLFELLEETEFAGKAMVFNGTNTDPRSREIYQAWLARNAGTDRVSGSSSADMRAALVEYFRDEAVLMIATEAAAEGINLQFCNLVVNYDLPWNPQRVEQRIGRCHRYGQKYDVVVVNFLNKKNAADVRVYELLDQKFKLFDGVFGASDEVLGTVESGVDFEKRIAAIYQQCRTAEQIQFEFEQLQLDLFSNISAGQQDAREKLLNNFDQEVVERVRVRSASVLDRVHDQLWSLTQMILARDATFDTDSLSFVLHRDPFAGGSGVPVGKYRVGRDVDDAHTYRIGHPLAQHVIGAAKHLPTPTVELNFDYSGTESRIAILEPLRGTRGALSCSVASVAGLEAEDHLITVATRDDGVELDDDQSRRLLTLPATIGESGDADGSPGALESMKARAIATVIAGMTERDARWFETEMEKLDQWAGDRRTSLRTQLADLDEEIKEAKKAARLAPTLPEKLERQRSLRNLEARRDEAWRAFDSASREIEAQKDALLDDITTRLQQEINETELFMIRWTLT